MTESAADSSWHIPDTEDAKWRVLYEELRDKPYGFQITYEEIADLLGKDIRTDGRWELTRTDKELQRSDQRALENVRRVGYRIAQPKDHIGLVKKRQKRSLRQTAKAISVGRATNLDEIEDPEVRRALVEVTDHLSNVQAQLRWQEKRLARNERSIAKLAEDVAADKARTVDQGEYIQNRLDSLERRLMERINAQMAQESQEDGDGSPDE